MTFINLIMSVPRLELGSTKKYQHSVVPSGCTLANSLDLMLVFPCTPLLSSRYRLSTVHWWMMGVSRAVTEWWLGGQTTLRFSRPQLKLNSDQLRAKDKKNIAEIRFWGLWYLVRWDRWDARRPMFPTIPPSPLHPTSMGLFLTY